MVQRAFWGTILTLIGAFMLGSPGVSATGESASLSSSGVNFEITPTSANPNGTVAIGTDELTVSSTCSSGYKLYISTTSNDESESSLVNADNSEYSIPTVSGTIASPTLLNSSASKNHWGFAMASSETGIADTGFSESTNATVTNTSLFSSIPTLDNMTTIRQKTSSADNETVNVYYGVNAGTDLTPGSYSSTVMYTMIMPSPCDYTLMFEDGVSDSDPVESEVTKMPEGTNVGRNTEVNLGDYVNEFSREGYSITGWKNLTDGLTYTKDQVVNINTNNSDIVKLSPIWAINNYTVFINTVTGISSVSAKIGSGSGTEVNNVSEAVQYGTTVTISYMESDGYHFTGWEIKNVDTDTEGNPLLEDNDIAQISSTDTYTFTMPASNVELSPKAEGNKYTVHFNPNGGTGEMVDTEMVYGSPATLPENTFAAPGEDYTFYGWSKTAQAPAYDVFRDYTNGQTGTFNLIPSNAAGTGETTLYAVWKWNAKIMQNWTGCNDLTVSTTDNYEDEDTYADLLDTRNNVVYRVRKYADQNCWMAENLRLAPGSSAPMENVTSGSVTLTTADSQGSGTITYSDNLGTSVTDYRARYDATNTSATTNSTYFTWATSLIACPAGWSLPTKTAWSDLLTSANITNNASGSTTFRNEPYNYNYSGNYSTTSLNNTNYGYYWSSTAANSNDAYRLLFTSSSVYVDSTARWKYNGFPVRCVLVPPSTSMQDFTADECTSLVTSTTENYNNADTYTTRVDIRNNVTYTIRKYSDNMCWMTENLRITPGSTDPGTTAVASGTLTTNTTTSQAAGSVSFRSSGYNGTYAASSGSYAYYDGNATYGTTFTWTAAKLVCPAGWTLPTKAQYSTFTTSEDIANSADGATKILGNPYNFNLTGWYASYEFSLRGTRGYFWTATAGSGNPYNPGTVFVIIDNSKVYLEPAMANYGGSAVRCIHS